MSREGYPLTFPIISMAACSKK